tara:strand:- start:15455 stop:15880 length:426 start_codon:yes stop_codon:yes gene_type:complete
MSNKRPSTDYIVVFSSETKEDDIGLNEISKKHRAQGFFKVAYHYIVRRNGDIETGRAEQEAGSLLSSGIINNSNSIAVCLVGDCTEHGLPNYTDEQLGGFRLLVNDLKSRYKLSVVGYSDVDNNSLSPFMDVELLLQAGGT